MQKLVLFYSFIFLFNTLNGQVSVTFQLDLNEMIEMKYFSPEAGDKVVVRGSFNYWTGNDYDLKMPVDNDVFTGTFPIGEIGDTISYKYVIIKKPNKEFWESKPNPENSDNGNRELHLTNTKLTLSPARFHYDEYINYPVVFSQTKLKEDFIQFREILESTHPALYDFTSKSELDSLFDKNYKQINSDMDFSSFLILMTEVIAKVGCGHSSMWVPRKFWQVAPEQLFPLKLQYSDGNLIVTGWYSKSPGIPIGSEIISINNRSIKEITARLIDLTSSDGFNPSYRQTKVAQNFSVKYAFAFGFCESFAVVYKKPGDKIVSRKNIHPVSKEIVDKGKTHKKELSFRRMEEINSGLLTISSFAYYGEVDRFQNFLDSVFTEIKENNIRHLIMDLRGNSGGDPFCSSQLWSFLEPAPLPYFEDYYGRYDSLADPIPKAQNAFTGKLYTLIDGHGFSTTGHFCGLLKYHKVGTFIGSELGSTYTCTGNATYPALINTGIMVGTARVRRYTTAVKDMDRTRGVMPDYQIEPSPEDIIKNKDVMVEKAIFLIKEGK